MIFKRNNVAVDLKVLTDKVFALYALLLLMPVMFATWFIIRIRMGKPSLYLDIRPGLAERPFVLYKFRTMMNTKSPEGILLKDAFRLTSLGRYLRRLSLDEIPQLWNVVKGDMSLVGPRPLRMDYLPFYTMRERIRHLVHPGITGWAQINGRNLASWDRRLEMDVWYVENWSLWLDFKILVLTALQVFRRKGVVDDPHSVMNNLDEERITSD